MQSTLDKTQKVKETTKQSDDQETPKKKQKSNSGKFNSDKERFNKAYDIFKQRTEKRFSEIAIGNVLEFIPHETALKEHMIALFGDSNSKFLSRIQVF